MDDHFRRRLKSIIQPFAKQRFLLERLKYLTADVADPVRGNDLIAACLTENRTVAIGKFGESELGGLKKWVAHRDESGKCDEWGKYARRLYANAGVYPSNSDVYSRFCERYARALGSLDMLAVWFQFGERRMQKKFAPHARLISQTSLEPFYYPRPWSAQLAGKRVLVISPFAETISRQYPRRTEVWRARPEVLPEFHLETLRCPLSAGIVSSLEYPDWFAALDAMCGEMDRRTYDAAIIGAGAWSVPLAAHAKKAGKFAIHLGGPTQLLFGIRGSRWDKMPFLQPIYNNAWVRPAASERPPEFQKVEGGCYW